MGYVSTREFKSAVEMRAHYAELKRRTFGLPSGPNLVTLPAPPPAPPPPAPEPEPAPPPAPPVLERLPDRPNRYACLRLVSAATGVAPGLICGAVRDKETVKARHLACWLFVKRLGYSLPETGRRLGGRDHTSVLHGVRRVEAAARSLALSLDGDETVFLPVLWGAEWPRSKDWHDVPVR